MLVNNEIGTVQPIAALAAPLYTADNKMTVPEDYRSWVFLTSSLDLNYNTAATPGHHMLDNVFVNPQAYAAFLKTGTWPEGAILIKENRKLVTGSITRWRMQANRITVTPDGWAADRAAFFRRTYGLVAIGFAAFAALLAIFFVGFDVETGQSQNGAHHVQHGDHPQQAGNHRRMIGFRCELDQQNRRCHAEADGVSQRIQFGPEFGGAAQQARDAAIDAVQHRRGDQGDHRGQKQR